MPDDSWAQAGRPESPLKLLLFAFYVENVVNFTYGEQENDICQENKDKICVKVF